MSLPGGAVAGSLWTIAVEAQRITGSLDDCRHASGRVQAAQAVQAQLEGCRQRRGTGACRVPI